MKKTTTHDAYVEHDMVKGPSNKNFGYTVGGILSAIAFIKAVFFSLSLFAIILLCVGITLMLGALFIPERLTPLNKAWMGLAKILFFIINPVMMFLLFCVAFIPGGLIMKLVGYDPMRRKFDPDAKTYWVEKEKSDIENPMTYQF